MSSVQAHPHDRPGDDQPPLPEPPPGSAEVLARMVAQLEIERDGYYHELQIARQRLDEIHGSKMWRFWMATIAVRRGLQKLLRWPLLVLAAVARGLLAVLKLPLSLLGAAHHIPAVLGWLWLRVSVPLAFLTRRRPIEAVADGSSEIDEGVLGRKPRVLIVSPYPIWPANHGGGVRLFNLIRQASDRAEIHLLVFSQSGADEAQAARLGPYCRQVVFHHWEPRFCPDRFGLLPSGAQLFRSPAVARTIRDLVQFHGIDIVQLEYAELGQYAADLPPGVKVVLTEHDIAFRSHRRRRELRFHRRYPEGNAFGESASDWRRLVAYELKWAGAVDRVHTMSGDDAAYLGSFLGDGQARIRVVPNGVDTVGYRPCRPFDERRGVLYVGNFQNLPNVDALEHLVRDIWPLVRLDSPDATLTVVGAKASERILRFDGRDGVEVVGEVPSLEPYYASHRVLAAPIRAGSGTRLKILEAFAAGLPVVSTTLGAEGISYRADESILIADRAVDFARAITRLLTDDDVARALSESARQLVAATYDWGAIADAMAADWNRLALDAADERRPSVEQQASPEVPRPRVDVSVIIPTLNGGRELERTLRSVAEQATDLRFDVLCVDSGSSAEDVAMMKSLGARVLPIEQRWFDHGLTRDLGAYASTGEILVFINQDATPADRGWLEALCRPLLRGDLAVAAVQGGIAEFPDPHCRYFWDSCGDRFYFTSEAPWWPDRYHNIGFSTVNCAIRRSVWERIPFGEAPIMEDKKWQMAVAKSELRIEHHPNALVHHSHVYTVRSLVRRCYSEGLGWRSLGTRYGFGTMLRDMVQPRMFGELTAGLLRGRVRSISEVLFPVLRPAALYCGNRFGRRVLH